MTTRSIHHCSPDGPTVGRLGDLTKCQPAVSDLIIVSLVVVIVHFLNCFNNFSRFRYSYMYIMLFITYICIFSDKLPSHIHTFGPLIDPLSLYRSPSLFIPTPKFEVVLYRGVDVFQVIRGLKSQLLLYMASLYTRGYTVLNL